MPMMPYSNIIIQHFHNHTEPFLSINFPYLVNDLVQCVKKKRMYEVIHCTCTEAQRLVVTA